MNFEIKYITSQETLDLRHLVLRQGRPKNSCLMEGDDLESTKHIGAFLDSRCVGVLSLFETTSPYLIEKHQYQLRGMAVNPNYRGQSIGKKLVLFSETELKTLNIELLWCNARTSAVGFYKKLNFEINSDEFQIPNIGPHYSMFKKLA